MYGTRHSSLSCVRLCRFLTRLLASLPDAATNRYRVYGISVLQAYMYFRHSGQDSIPLRSFVSKECRIQCT